MKNSAHSHQSCQDEFGLRQNRHMAVSGESLPARSLGGNASAAKIKLILNDELKAKLVSQLTTSSDLRAKWDVK